MSTTKNLIYLISCGLNNIEADKSICKSINFDEIYKIAKKHHLTPLIYCAIKNHSFINLKNWRYDFESNTRKNMLLDTERYKICKFMKDNKIWFTELKGTILQNYYPHYGIRQMADNDILFDKTYENVLNEYLINLGYTYKNEIVHNTFTKFPIYNFEMHKMLFSTTPPRLFHTYFFNIKKRLINKNPNNSYEKIMTDIDFYIYQLCHTFKHNIRIGIGLKQLIDIYIAFKKLNINKEKLETELKKLKIYNFEKKYRNLSFKLFDNPNINIKLRWRETRLLQRLIKSSTYGTKKNYFTNKIRYFWLFPTENLKYYFPSYENLKQNNHINATNKLFMPYYWTKQLSIKIKNKVKK